jgi:hypothetical protein
MARVNQCSLVTTYAVKQYTTKTTKRFVILLPLEVNVGSATACMLKLADIDVAKIFWICLTVGS